VSPGLLDDFTGISPALEASKIGCGEDLDCGKTAEEVPGLCAHPTAKKMNNTIKVR
jgi:hypothetical protein